MSDIETTPHAPCVARLLSHHGAQLADMDTHHAFVRREGDHVLLFSGDPVRFPEGQDVAVVLPELRAAHGERFDIGVVPVAQEDAVAAVWGVTRWPSLVFVRDGRYVTTLAGMHDWTDFVARVGEALAAPPSRAPSIGIRVVSADAPAGCR